MPLLRLVVARAFLFLIGIWVLKQKPHLNELRRTVPLVNDMLTQNTTRLETVETYCHFFCLNVEIILLKC